MQPFTVACVQTTSARSIADNLPVVTAAIDEAAARGASFVLLPENVAMLEPDSGRLQAAAAAEEAHPALAAFADAARRRGIWLLVGSLAIRTRTGGIVNRSLLLDPTGAVAARYDKIHLFDVDIGAGERYRESATFTPGSRAVVAPLPWGALGMTVCYDLRFPQLYRTLARRGAVFLAVPAAFTRPTGEAHWHVLLRARAIECGAFVFAPAQCGEHAEGRRTYGHSLIVDPWGTVLADGGDAAGVITADIDPGQVRDFRRRLPSLQHDRAYD